MLAAPVTPVAQPDPGYPPLGKGDKGDEVVWLQQHLKSYDPALAVDGRPVPGFDPGTLAYANVGADPVNPQITATAADNGTVTITHHGRPAGTLRGAAAARFLAAVARGDDPQLLMARVTGNYKHGNERRAREHPRNRGR